MQPQPSSLSPTHFEAPSDKTHATREILCHYMVATLFKLLISHYLISTRRRPSHARSPPRTRGHPRPALWLARQLGLAQAQTVPLLIDMYIHLYLRSNHDRPPPFGPTTRTGSLEYSFVHPMELSSCIIITNYITQTNTPDTRPAALEGPFQPPNATVCWQHHHRLTANPTNQQHKFP